MSKTIIDMSGSQGLVPKYFGDINRAAADPNLRYIGKSGQFADGIFNPIKRYGYISPSNQATKAIALTGSVSTIPSVVRATIYDPVNDKSFLLFTNVLAIGTGAKPTSFATTADSVSTGSDLIFYTLSGVRKIFIARNDKITVFDPAYSVYDDDWSATPLISTATISNTDISGTPINITINTNTGYDSAGGIYIQPSNAGENVRQFQYTSKTTTTFAGVTGGSAGLTATLLTLVYQGASGGLSTGITEWDYNRFVLADNGFLYVLNKSAVHKIDGTVAGGPSGTITFNVLTASAGGIFYDGIDYRGNMYLAMNQVQATNNIRNQESDNATPVACGVYIWDRLSTITRMRDFIPLYGAKEIRRIWVSPRGEVLVIALGSNNACQLFQFTGTGFKFLQELGANAYPMQWGSLVVGTNYSYWTGADGILYGWGATNPADPETLCRLLNLNTTASVAHPGTSGIFRMGASLLTQASYTVSSGYADALENLYLSYGYTLSGSNYDAVKYIINGVDTQDSVTPVANQGDVYTMVQRLPVFATINYIRLYNLPTASTGATTIATIKVYVNHSAAASASYTVSQKEAALGYKYIGERFPEVYAVQLEIEFGTSAQLGTDDYCPLYAEIDYTEDTKQR